MEEQVVDEGFVSSLEHYREKPEGVGLFEACADNPVLFCEHMIGVKPYAWQVPFLISIRDWAAGERSKNVLAAMTSRQIGKSFTLAIAALWLTLFNKVPDKSMGNTRVAIVSRGDQQARGLLKEVKLWMRHGDRYMRETYLDEDGSPVFGKEFFTDLLSKDEENNQRSITFKSSSDLEHPFLLAGSRAGSWIHSYPPTPIVLGETFTVGMIDEAAHSSIEDEFIVRELMPTGMANDALWITTSTPWKASGWFHSIMTGDDEDVKRFVFSIEAIKDEPLGEKQYEAAQRDIRKLREDGDLVSVNIVYYCKFEQGELSFFDPLKVQGLFSDDSVMMSSYTGLCDMGVDFGGRSTSRSVITISRLDEDTGVVERLYHRRYGVKDDDDIVEDIARLRMQFNVQRIIPDDCPQGDYLIREMVSRGWNVQPDGRGMNFRTDKVRKYNAFRALVNKGLVVSYPDADLRDEMLAMEHSQGSSQSKIVPAKGYTDDLVDSFIMSAYFMLQDDAKRVGFLDWDEL